jgi:hypothetical protein
MTKTNLPTSLPGADAAYVTNDIRAIKAPVAIPDVWFWILAAAVLLVLAGLAWWIWRRRRRKQNLPPAQNTVPAHIKAWRSLQDALSLLAEPRPFCILVSDTVRTYLEERFDLRAPERTTEEFLDELRSSALLSLNQKQTLGEFLMSCDLVKFARYQPGEAELKSLHAAAVRLVKETEPPSPDEAADGLPQRALPKTVP